MFPLYSCDLLDAQLPLCVLALRELFLEQGADLDVEATPAQRKRLAIHGNGASLLRAQEGVRGDPDSESGEPTETAITTETSFHITSDIMHTVRCAPWVGWYSWWSSHGPEGCTVAGCWWALFSQGMETADSVQSAVRVRDGLEVVLKRVRGPGALTELQVPTNSSDRLQSGGCLLTQVGVCFLSPPRVVSGAVGTQRPCGAAAGYVCQRWLACAGAASPGHLPPRPAARDSRIHDRIAPCTQLAAVRFALRSVWTDTLIFVDAASLG